MPSFLAKATAGNATAADVTCNVPSGTLNDHVLLFFLSKDATDAVTWPSGWNILTELTSNTFYMGIGWRRAASEPANYTWTFASTWRDCVMLTYQSVASSSNPLDPDTPPAGVENGSATSLATNNITTGLDNSVVVAFGNQKAIITWAAAPGSYTARQNAGSNECFVMDQSFATAQTVTGPTITTAGGTPAGAMKVYILALEDLPPAGHTPGVANIDVRRMIP